MRKAPLTDEYLHASEQLLHQVARENFGPLLAHRRQLQQAVHALSARYNALGEEAGGDKTVAAARSAAAEPLPLSDDAALAARLVFFTVADLPKAAFALAELNALGRLSPGPLRLLDLGAGCGALSLGAIGFLGAAQPGRALHIDALDRDRRPLSMLRQVLARGIACAAFPAQPTLSCHVADLRGAWPVSGPYDLVLLGNALTEIAEADHQDIVRRALALLDLRGVAIIIEPALRSTARALHRLRDRLLAAGDVVVLAPCTHHGPCPMLAADQDWCHERRSATPPPELRQLALACGLRQRELRWSYLTLAPRPPAAGDRPAALGSNRWRVVSDVMRSKGRRELFVCGAAGRRRVVRLDRHQTAANLALGDLGRGQVIELIGDGGQESAAQVIKVGATTIVRATDPALQGATESTV